MPMQGIPHDATEEDMEAWAMQSPQRDAYREYLSVLSSFSSAAIRLLAFQWPSTLREFA
jgi:hypothetical protein